MEKISIRKATKKEYKEVIKLYGLFVENEDRYKNYDNDSYNTVINDPNAILELAVIESKIVGFIMYSIRHVIRYPKPIVEVEEFFVLEEYRGMKIGKKLMDKVITFAKEQDCQYIFLASGKERIPAHHFYKNCDFDEYAFHYRRKP